MVHTTLQSSQNLHLNSCPVVAPRLVFRRRINCCQVSVIRRWQLASRRRLLQSECWSVSCNRSIEMEITGRKIRTPSRKAVTNHVFNWQYGVQLITDRPVRILSWTSGENCSVTRFVHYIEEEIKSRLKSGNACYHSVQNLLSSRLLSKNTQINP